MIRHSVCIWCIEIVCFLHGTGSFVWNNLLDDISDLSTNINNLTTVIPVLLVTEGGGYCLLELVVCGGAVWVWSSGIVSLYRVVAMSLQQQQPTHWTAQIPDSFIGSSQSQQLATQLRHWKRMTKCESAVRDDVASAHLCTQWVTMWLWEALLFDSCQLVYLWCVHWIVFVRTKCLLTEPHTTADGESAGAGAVMTWRSELKVCVYDVSFVWLCECFVRCWLCCFEYWLLACVCVDRVCCVQDLLTQLRCCFASHFKGQNKICPCCCNSEQSTV